MSRKNDHSDSAQDAAADLPPATGELAGAPDVVSQPEEADDKPRKPGSDKVQRFRERRKAGVIAVLRHPIRKDHVERLQKIDQLYGLHMGTEVLDAENVDEAVVFGAFDKVLDLAMQHHPLIALKMDLQALGAGQPAAKAAPDAPLPPEEPLKPLMLKKSQRIVGVNGATFIDLRAGTIVTDQAVLRNLQGNPYVEPAPDQEANVRTRVHACRCGEEFLAPDSHQYASELVCKEAFPLSFQGQLFHFRNDEIIEPTHIAYGWLQDEATGMADKVEWRTATVQICEKCGQKFNSPLRGARGWQIDAIERDSGRGHTAISNQPNAQSLPLDLAHIEAKRAAIMETTPIESAPLPDASKMTAAEYQEAARRAVMGG